MDGTFGNLRLFAADPPGPADRPADPVALANRELLRPPTCGPGRAGPDPYSAGWFDELDRKRYARHGAWLPAALEFARHPGESVLLLSPGLGTDAARYARQGCEVAVAVGPGDPVGLVRENLARQGLAARLVPAFGPTLPLPDGTVDVVVLNALHRPAPAVDPAELYRVLKVGGKLIALFPAHYDAGYWQDLFLPLQHLYWRRPPDPTTAPKETAAGLRRRFGRFADHRFARRHLRRGELPHPWRVVPLVVLERLIGRVLVMKAFKPLSAARPAAVRVEVPEPLAA